VQPGEHVDAGQPVLILESMKAEITVAAVWSGAVRALLCAEGQVVAQGQALLAIARD
jgi:urea carboxylase